MRVYDEAGNVIETHVIETLEYAGDFNELVVRNFCSRSTVRHDFDQ